MTVLSALHPEKQNPSNSLTLERSSEVMPLSENALLPTFGHARRDIHILEVLQPLNMDE